MAQSRSPAQAREPNRTEIIEVLEAARLRLQYSQDLLEYAMSSARSSLEPFYELDCHAFGNNIFASCKQSAEAFKGVFAKLAGLKGLDTRFDKNPRNWDHISTLYASMQRASAVTNLHACSDERCGLHHETSYLASMTDARPDGRPRRQRQAQPARESWKRAGSANDDDDDDDALTPRASKMARTDAWRHAVEEPAGPYIQSPRDAQTTQHSRRKRAAESDEDSELSQRATKVIRITDDTPTRKTFAMAIKKRKAAGKSQRHDRPDDRPFSDIPTPQSATGSATPVPSKTGSTSGFDDDYEDVSAEVAARLQAKEKQRLVKKGEMKRKRSADSLVEDAPDVAVRVVSTPASKRQR